MAFVGLVAFGSIALRNTNNGARPLSKGTSDRSVDAARFHEILAAPRPRKRLLLSWKAVPA